MSPQEQNLIHFGSLGIVGYHLYHGLSIYFSFLSQPQALQKRLDFLLSENAATRI